MEAVLGQCTGTVSSVATATAAKSLRRVRLCVTP